MIDSTDNGIKFLSFYLKPQLGIKFIGICILLVVVSFLISLHLRVDLGPLFTGIPYFIDITTRMLPPDFSNGMELMKLMVETVEIGFLATFLSTVFSIPIGIWASRGLVKSNLYYPSRLLITFFRAIPEFIVAMILVICVGFGALSGIVALALHTMGFLAKFYAEEIEHIKIDPVEAIASTGASFTQKIMYGIVPQILPAFVGYSLYILDRNIRMATVLGMVGAGGIGYELISSFRMFNYPRVSAIVIIILITIFAIDILSSKIRHSIK